MDKYESSLKLEKYNVNEVHFVKNNKFEATEKEINLNLQIKKDVKIEGQKLEVTLNTKVFDNSSENNYPFEMEVSITGYFSVKGDKPEVFEKNAIAILYPYVRSIVSTYTANSNTITLVLPIINVNKLIEDQEN